MVPCHCGVQKHTYDPAVLLHVPPLRQGGDVVHSSTSNKYIIRVQLIPGTLGRQFVNAQFFHFQRAVKEALPWRHNERDGVSYHTRLDCVPKRLFRRRSKENIKATCNWLFERRIQQWPVISPHKGPATSKMFPFADVIMSNGKFSSAICTLVKRARGEKRP